jgi:hypothetical protein
MSHTNPLKAAALCAVAIALTKAAWVNPSDKPLENYTAK